MWHTFILRAVDPASLLRSMSPDPLWLNEVGPQVQAEQIIEVTSAWGETTVVVEGRWEDMVAMKPGPGDAFEGFDSSEYGYVVSSRATRMRAGKGQLVVKLRSDEKAFWELDYIERTFPLEQNPRYAGVVDGGGTHTGGWVFSSFDWPVFSDGWTPNSALRRSVLTPSPNASAERRRDCVDAEGLPSIRLRQVRGGDGLV